MPDLSGVANPRCKAAFKSGLAQVGGDLGNGGGTERLHQRRMLRVKPHGFLEDARVVGLRV